MGSKIWDNSPMKEFGDFSAFNGMLMAEIPNTHRLPDVNPHLIDKLQLLWDHRCTPERRLMLIDLLEHNLMNTRHRLPGNLEENRLVIFHGDPKEACP